MPEKKEGTHVMVQNISHDNEKYKKGERVSLKKNVLELFLKNGWATLWVEPVKEEDSAEEESQEADVEKEEEKGKSAVKDEILVDGEPEKKKKA